MSTSGSVDQYAAWLTDLEAQRAKIDAAIAAIKALRSNSTAPEAPQGRTQESPMSGHTFGTSVPAVPPKAFEGLNLPDAALKYLQMRSGHVVSTGEIKDALTAGGQSSSSGDNFTNVLYNALKRLHDRRDIVKDGSKWALSVGKSNGVTGDLLA